MTRMPVRYRRAKTTERTALVTAVFRASFPEVPAEVVTGHLEGEPMLTLTRTGRRIIDLCAADYDRALAALIAGQPVSILGVRADDYDDDAVARSIARQTGSLSAVMLGRIISRLANDQAIDGLWNPPVHLQVEG